MTDAELHKIAKKTAIYGVHSGGEYIYSFYIEPLRAFAKLVAEHEREACAKIADIAEPYKSADLIRARGQA
jgi:hypothetical protein